MARGKSSYRHSHMYRVGCSPGMITRSILSVRSKGCGVEGGKSISPLWGKVHVLEDLLHDDLYMGNE